MGPQTIWRGGWGIALEGERIRAKGGTEEEWALGAEILYGVTEDVNVLLSVPVVRRRAETVLVPGVGQVERDATGVGDVVVRAKFRFWQDLFRNGNHQAALVAGVKLPAGRTGTEPPLGSGSVDYLLGAAVSRETHRTYAWASALGRLNTEALGRRRGHELRYDLALGIRPYVPEWTDPDLMFVLELVGVTAGRTVTAEGKLPDTGGTVLAFATGFWLTLRNWALQGSVKLPFLQDLNGAQPELEYEAITKLEVHFGG